jgi:hypothetical protein
MQVAYIILCHKLPEQVVRLVRRLQGNHAGFFIHVDRRADVLVYDKIAAEVGPDSNVSMLERQPLTWGSFGHVAATSVALEEIGPSRRPFDVVFLLTGQDYPVRSNAEILAFLQANSGRSFLHAFRVHDVEKSPWGERGPNRYRHWHLYWLRRHLELPARRRMPGRLEPYGGSAYWCLTAEAVDYVCTFMRTNTKFEPFFRHVASPEEMFFQTILMNSPVADRVRADVEYGVHYIDWSVRRSHPRILTVDDLETIRSSTHVFARKFDITVDSSVLDELDSLDR